MRAAGGTSVPLMLDWLMWLSIPNVKAEWEKPAARQRGPGSVSPGLGAEGSATETRRRHHRLQTFRRTSLAGRLGCRTQGAALGRRGQGQAERGSDGERGRRMLARRRETAVKGEPLFTAQQRLESARVKCYRNQTPGFRPGFAGLLPDAYASVCLLFYQNTGHVPLAKRCWGIRKRGDSSLRNPQLLPL